MSILKRWAVFTLVLWPHIAYSSSKIDTSGVMALFGNGFGHACPVEGIVYTARHAIRRGGPGGQQIGPPFFFTWEDSAGRKGRAQPKNFDQYRDIGELMTRGDTPHFYKKARSLPKPGETIHWVQFTQKDMQDESKKGKIKYYRAGYAFFDRAPDVGASGSCLFNAKGLVVGIVTWRLEKASRQGAAAIIDWLQ